ncbi:hypothetical protein Lepto7375DRAFT_6490 [Leptolyngbya sp. PCC 7375]|nr:hypothetical protein Lepto7375DRAFT_6490 [Leptolyngbya sp. PCC 7375]
MPSPFPGMDPYLENPEIWPEVHSRLIVAIADSLAPSLHPKYYAAIEKRTYLDTPEDSILVGIPDVSVSTHPPELKTANRTATTLPQAEIVTLPLPEEVTERYLEIRDTQTSTVITAIEILSPKNKRSGEGRTAYLRKRQQVLSTQTHLVEIDLLRGQAPMPLGTQTKTDYRILVSRSSTRPKAELYSFDLQTPIPTFCLPLKTGELEPEINLKTILDDIHDRAGYSFRINYQQPPKPALGKENQQWATTLLKNEE